MRDHNSYRETATLTLMSTSHVIFSGNIISAGGTFLKGTTKFDNVEFGASNKDSASMTASTRRLIELGFLAMLDAGIDSRGQKIGTFFAGTNAEYFEGVSGPDTLSIMLNNKLLRTISVRVALA